MGFFKEWKQDGNMTFSKYIGGLAWNLYNSASICPINELIKNDQLELKDQCIWDLPIPPFSEITFDDGGFSMDRLLYLGKGDEMPNRFIEQTQWDKIGATRIDVEWDDRSFIIKSFGSAPLNKNFDHDEDFYHGCAVEYDWEFTLDKHIQWINDSTKNIGCAYCRCEEGKGIQLE